MKTGAQHSPEGAARNLKRIRARDPMEPAVKTEAEASVEPAAKIEAKYQGDPAASKLATGPVGLRDASPTKRGFCP